MTDPSESLRTLSIGAVAARSGVSTSALRFYESRDLIASDRTEGGQRSYRRSVLRRIAFIQAGQRVGLSLDEIRAAMAHLPATHAPGRDDWKRASQEWRPLLEDRIAILQRLLTDLDGCVGCGCLSLDTCKLVNPRDRAAVAGPGAPLLPMGKRRSSS